MAGSQILIVCLLVLLAPAMIRGMGLAPHSYIVYDDQDDFAAVLVADTALIRAMEIWDRDNDGFVSQSEFSVVYAELFEPREIEASGGSHDGHNHKRVRHALQVQDHVEGHEEEYHDEDEDHEEDHDEGDDHDEEHDDHDEEHDDHDDEHDDHDEEHDDHDEEHDDHDEDEDHDHDEDEDHDHDEDEDHDHDEDEDHDHDEGEDHDHDEDGDHDHDEDGDHDHDGEDGHDHEEESCMPENELFALYDSNRDGDLDISELSPTMHEMVLMAYSGCGGCIEAEESSSSDDDCEEPEVWEKWLYALLATLIISLASLIGVCLIPANMSCFKNYVLETMVCFGVGALVGATLFELLPVAYNLHGSEEGEEVDERDAVWGAAAVGAGILFFFFLERIISFLFVLFFKAYDRARGTNAAEEEARDEEAGEEVKKDKSAGGHSHGGLDLTRGDKRRLKSVGVLNLVSDAVHNLIDGFAIGAAFSQDLGTGLAASIAILLHEVPQELGDFSILLYAGFPKWMALSFNFLSAIVSFIGTVCGLIIGENVQSADRWILAVVAGAFLYVALVDMLGQVKNRPGLLRGTLMGIAIAIGMAIMMALRLLEEYLPGSCAGGHAH